MSGEGSLPHAACGAVVASGAPDSAVPTTPPSRLTAAPGLGPARESADACQAPDPRHCWAWRTGWVQRQRLTLGDVAVLCPCQSPPG
eukprot:scaffold3822_cov142-Isochrysis_galbana.AAC.4